MSDSRGAGRSGTVPASLEFYTVAETAAILGVSRRLVTNWIHDGALPVIRLGPGQRLLRIKRSDLESFIGQYGGDFKEPPDKGAAVSEL